MSKKSEENPNNDEWDIEAEQNWANFWQAVLMEWARKFPEESKKFMEEEKNKRFKK